MSGILGEGLLGDFLLGDGSSDFTGAHGQAQAYILVFDYPRHGQAQSDILQIYNSFAQSQADIKQTYQGYAQAQATILARVHGQAQSSILQTYNSFAQSQADILQIYNGYGQAQGKIGEGSGTQSYSQALAFICWTDTFTRSTAFGLGSDYTWVEYDTTFNAQEDSTYKVDGSKVVDTNGVNEDADSYQINRSVPIKGTAKFNFTTTTTTDTYGHTAIIFGEDYTAGGLSFGIYYDSVLNKWILTGTWNTAATGLSSGEIYFETESNTTYTVKYAYNDLGNFAVKIWKTSDPESDWLIAGTTDNFVINTIAWLDLEFGTTIGSLDDLNFCIEETFPLLIAREVGQAAAQITNTTPNAQAAAQITNTTPSGNVQAYVAFEGVEVINENFNRSTTFGFGRPYFLWSNQGWLGASVDHPAASLIRIDGSKLNIPEDSYETQYFGLNSKVIGRIQFNFTVTNTSDLTETLFHIIGKDGLNVGLIYYPPLSLIFFGQLIDDGVNPPTISGGSGLTISAGVTYTVYVRRSGDSYTSYFALTDVNPDSNFFTAAGGGPVTHTYTPANHVLELRGPTTGIKFDNLVITPPQSTGLARAKIKAIDSNKHGQARAKIKAIGVKSYGQAQTYIGHFKHGQAQAEILQTYFGFAQAQARIADGGALEFQVYAQALAHIGTYFTWGFAQSLAYIGHFKSAQAQAYMVKFRGNSPGQARARIKAQRWVWAQGQAFIRPRVGSAEAQAKIIRFENNRIAQAQGYIVGGYRTGQAQSYIKNTNQSYAQAHGFISGQIFKFGQARARINSSIKNASGQARANIDITHSFNYAQVQATIHAVHVGIGAAVALINGSAVRYAQSQAFILRSIRYGQAQAWINQSEAGYLIKYNNYLLPGYLQQETLLNEINLFSSESEYSDFGTSEYTGLKNKFIDIRMLVVESTYRATKDQINLAGTMLRSSRSDFVRLTLKRPDRYYLAKTTTIRTEQEAGRGENRTEYGVTFETKPWAYGITTHTLTGTIDTDSVGRTLSNGTWTPAIIRLTGTNITVSGYTDTEDFTGFISVSGAVNNLVIDSESYSVTMDGVNRNDLMNSYDYQMYIGPGRTRFTTTGVTEITVEYEDRWPL